VARERKGYIEDRRPNANMDPYVVARLITDTVCSAFEGGATKAGRATASTNGAKASKAGAATKVSRNGGSSKAKAKAGARR
jgi:hypothetical protein